MQMSPVIAVHLTAALAALVLGPIALWARRGHGQPGRSVTSRPRLHRAAGYAWVSMMLLAALSALFIRDFTLPNIAGYTPLHLLVPTTLVMLVIAFRALARGDIRAHRQAMARTYVGACVVAELFTLLPSRYLGQLMGAMAGLAVTARRPPPHFAPLWRLPSQAARAARHTVAHSSQPTRSTGALP